MSTVEAVPVEVPDIGDFEAVPVIEIHVSEGDSVALDDPLLTLESDKATMDVPAPFAGRIRELHVKVGDKVSQGTLLFTIEPAGASEGTAAPNEMSRPSRAATIASEGAPSEAAAPDAIATALEAEGPPPPPELPAPAADGFEPVYASPTVRRRARELGIDLRAVTGSGRKGRITLEDLDGVAAPSVAPPSAGVLAPGPGIAPWPSLDFSKQGPVERVPRSRIQRISAPNLARNWALIPHVTHNDEADITELESWRVELNKEHAGDEPDRTGAARSGEAGGRAGGKPVKVTMVSFLIVASVTALKEYPDFNSSLDGDELIRKLYYNIGFAADTPEGLVVPVIKDADAKGLLEIARELSGLSARARDGKLGPADISAGTFTVSSLGGIGGTSFTPIVNAPEVAILGVTRAAIKPVWNGEEFVPRLMLPLSLSYDHRAIDGAAAARFVAYLARVLGDLRRALL
jgi:pyruvate dehydrogenase E2 component (dihydrolipoyllysine-residue acetyltransferase)